MLVAHSENWSLAPCTHTGQLRTVCNSSSRKPNTLFWSHVDTQIGRHMHINKKAKQKKQVLAAQSFELGFHPSMHEISQASPTWKDSMLSAGRLLHVHVSAHTHTNTHTQADTCTNTHSHTHTSTFSKKQSQLI